MMTRDGDYLEMVLAEDVVAGVDGGGVVYK